jgi:hypothetical protein
MRLVSMCTETFDIRHRCENRASRLQKLVLPTEVSFLRSVHEVHAHEQQDVLPASCLIIKQLE